jgi:hypothetical protein
MQAVNIPNSPGRHRDTLRSVCSAPASAIRSAAALACGRMTCAPAAAIHSSSTSASSLAQSLGEELLVGSQVVVGRCQGLFSLGHGGGLTRDLDVSLYLDESADRQSPTTTQSDHAGRLLILLAIDAAGATGATQLGRGPEARAMANRGNDKRLDLFRRNSGNLRLFEKAATDIFRCPICATRFLEADVRSVNGAPPRVDVAHVYPQAAGGRILTLECRGCNSKLNRACDNEIVLLHNQWEAMRSGSTSKPITGHLRTSVGRVPVAVSARGMHASESKSNPTAFRALVDALRHRDSIEIVTPDVDHRRLDLALLHSAHLLFFREFSYGYLLTNVGEYLRSILNSPTSFTEPPYLTLEVPLASALDRRVLFRIGIAQLPDKTRCLFAALPVANPNMLCQIMLLPGLGPDDISNHARVMSLDGKWLQNVQFVTLSGGSSKRLAAPEFAFQLLNLWRGATPDQIRLRALLQGMHSISASSRVDASDVALRLGISAKQLPFDFASLLKLGYLERSPQNRKPYLGRLTPAGIKALDRRARHVPKLARVFAKEAASALENHWRPD